MKNDKETSTILLVEDEESLAIGLAYNLTEEGFYIITCKDGTEAVQLFGEHDIDLIILDIMLPHMDGFEVAEKIRESSPRVPILMLTARTQPEDRIKGLQTGADDYITKPFHVAELILRVKRMLKRTAWYKTDRTNKTVYRAGTTIVDFNTLTCTTGAVSHTMTPLEGRLLKYFMDNPGRIIPRSELLTRVWRTTSDVQTRTIDIFISRLRKYIEEKPSNPRYLKNIRGAGYMFHPE